jgi:hemoglobin-like flavoprotein
VQDAEINEDDIKLAKDSWNNIIEDRSPAYVENRGSPGFEHTSCISWFYSIFYERLFNVHPMCRPLFTSGIVSQGKFLVKMVSMILNCLKDKTKFIVAMQELAMRHCERGIRGVEYGIVGDVLFYSLQKSTGSIYTIEVERAWKKIFSSILTIIVPLCVEYERTGAVHCAIERVSDSGALLDSSALAVIEADRKAMSDIEAENKTKPANKSKRGKSRYEVA